MKKRGYLFKHKKNTSLRHKISNLTSYIASYKYFSNMNQSNQPYSLTLCVIELSRMTRKRDEDSFAADISDKYILTRYCQLSEAAIIGWIASLIPILLNVAWRKWSYCRLINVRAENEWAWFERWISLSISSCHSWTEDWRCWRKHTEINEQNWLSKK